MLCRMITRLGLEEKLYDTQFSHWVSQRFGKNGVVSEVYHEVQKVDLKLYDYLK